MEHVSFTYKVWIAVNGKPVIGPGGARILEAIDRLGSISKASKELGMSYRFVWGYIRRVEDTMKVKVVKRQRGGRGGGYTTLTREGKVLLEAYKNADSSIRRLIEALTRNLRSTLKP